MNSGLPNLGFVFYVFWFQICQIWVLCFYVLSFRFGGLAFSVSWFRVSTFFGFWFAESRFCVFTFCPRFNGWRFGGACNPVLPGCLSPRFLRRAFVFRFCFRYLYPCVLPDQGFAALPFLRFAKTAITAIPATRITPPVIANGKTGEPLFLFSRFCVSTFSRSGFAGLAFIESGFSKTGFVFPRFPV